MNSKSVEIIEPKKMPSTLAKGSSIRHIKSKNEFQAALASAGNKKVVVDFHAKWCGPCKQIAPKYNELATKYTESCVAISVDVDECEVVAEECGITAMPTFHVYKGGKKVNEMVGASSASLEAIFNK